VIAALLLLASPIAPQAPKPIDTTIGAIRADPKRFDDAVVRLHGWVNRCTPAGCVIDERPATSPTGPGQDLTVAPNPKFDSTLKPLIPTYVEMDARVDASCVSAATCPGLTVVLLRGVIDATVPPPED
jgi:hypothetical protein